MTEFETTDFVQVETFGTTESGEPYLFWRNALYVGFQESGHIVLYTDGTKQALNRCQKIRKAKLNE